MRKKKQRWKAGDLFLVPLCDGTFSVGQIVAVAKEAMDSVVCVFSGSRIAESFPVKGPDPASAISIVFVTRDLLDSGRWKVVGHAANDWSASLIGFDRRCREGFVGVKVIGSANIEALLNAFNSLQPWNGFHDPEYFDRLLLSAQLKPSTVMIV